MMATTRLPLRDGRYGRCGRRGGCLRVPLWPALLALLAAAGCGAFLRPIVDDRVAADPDLLNGLRDSGLLDLVPYEELEACGPGGSLDELNELIPDCPLGLVCFTAACVAHDKCYNTCGTTQADCDQTFFWDLVSLCHDRHADDLPTLEHCYSLAWVYYNAVHLFGQAFFDGSQRFVCRQEAREGAGEQLLRSLGSVDPGPPPFPDMDQDLVPDDWEVAHGLDPADASDAFADPDGDGLANLTEFIHATDPFNPDTDGDGLPDGTAALARPPE